MLSQCCHTVATLLSQCCYNNLTITMLLHHTVLPNQCCHIVVIILWYCCHNVATLLSQCCHIANDTALQWWHLLTENSCSYFNPCHCDLNTRCLSYGEPRAAPAFCSHPPHPLPQRQWRPLAPALGVSPPLQPAPCRGDLKWKYNYGACVDVVR